ncbi:MAG TPA: ATP-binding protein, partial [Caulobacteraceae bacterium]
AEAIMGMVERRQTRLDKPLCYRGRHKDGREIWVEANPVLTLDEQGEPLEIIDIVRDVTEKKLFEEELKKARAVAEAAAAAKATFLANMSHELRTPLTSIIGFSRFMQERQDLAPDAVHYVKRISDASDALLAIINDILDFSKLEAGQVSLESLPFSLRRLVDETTGLVAVQAAAKGLKIRLQVSPKGPEMITGDVARLRQVLLNFLSNAVKFTAEGSVTVKAAWRETREGPRLRISVTDTGGGIDPKTIERLFQRFSQADVSINRTHGGTGLGLAISKAIVTLMDGKIGVRSEPGEGSTFWFEVPAPAALGEAAAATDAVSPEEWPSVRILVVDDAAVNRELVKLMLEPLGLRVEEASGGAEAVQAAMNTPFDLILMDVRMPGVDGLEATRVIRGASFANRTTPIIALTADVQPENAAACRAAGMNDVLAKPIVPRQLLAAIVAHTADQSDDLAQVG